MSYGRWNRRGLPDTDFLADVCESVYRGTRRSYRWGRPGGRDEPCNYGGPVGDFLYSMVKIQASQLNQLARFGLANADYARRTLEALYFGYGGGGACTGEPDIFIKDKVKADVERHFTIENRCGPDDAEVAILCGRFTRGRGEDVQVTPKFLIEKKPANDAKLKKNQQEVVTMKFTLDEKHFTSGCDYTAIVEVRIGGETVNELLVVVEVT